MHLFKPLILLVWDGVRWGIAILTAIAWTALMYHHGLPDTILAARLAWRGNDGSALVSSDGADWLVSRILPRTPSFMALSDAAIPLLMSLYIVSSSYCSVRNQRASLLPRWRKTTPRKRRYER